MQIKKVIDKIFGRVVYTVSEHSYSKENQHLNLVDQWSDVYRTKEAATKAIVAHGYHIRRALPVRGIGGLLINTILWEKPDGCGGNFYAKINEVRPKK